MYYYFTHNLYIELFATDQVSIYDMGNLNFSGHKYIVKCFTRLESIVQISLYPYFNK